MLGMKVLVLCFTFILFFNFVDAHTCATFKNFDDKEHFKELSKTKIIFQGELISISDRILTKKNHQYSTLTFKVRKSWKDVESNQVKALFAVNNPCGINLEIGKTYMIYSSDSETPFEIDCCSFGLFDEKRIETQLGEGKVFSEESQITSNEPTESFWTNIWSKFVSIFS